MGQFITGIEQKIIAEDMIEAKLSTLITEHFRQLSADYRLAVVTQLELRQSNKGLRAQIGEVLKRYLQVIDELVEKGKQQGVFKKHIDTRLARQMIFGTIDETATNWVLSEKKYQLTQLSGQVNDLLIYGLSYNNE